MFLIFTEQCLLNSQLYDDGDEYESQCHNCKCIDGVVKCNPIECPKLECSIEKQLQIADECCPYCKGMLRSLNNLPINPLYYPHYTIYDDRC